MKDDGGPAFPTEEGCQTYDPDGVMRFKVNGILPGMSLRDYFAAKAMQYVAGTDGVDVWKIEGHLYLVNYHGGMVHAEHCPCKKKEMR